MIYQIGIDRVGDRNRGCKPTKRQALLLPPSCYRPPFFTGRSLYIVIAHERLIVL